MNFLKRTSAYTWWDFLQTTPLLLPVVLIAFGSVLVVLALLGSLRNELIWTIGPLVAFLAALPVVKYGRIDTPGSLKERRLVTVLALLFVGLWVGWNALYASQAMFTGRDSAIYVNTAIHVIHNDNLLPAAPNVFGDQMPNLRAGSPWFQSIGGQGPQYFQGSHLFSLLLGAVGRVSDEAVMLRLAAPVIGGVALLAVFAFARLFLKPRYALLAIVALGISLPMIYFSRDTYTEPLLMIAAFSALATLWIAQAKNNASLWLVAGLLAGAAAMVRVDGLLISAALALGAFCYPIFMQNKQPIVYKQTALFMVGMLLMVLLAWLDLYLLSRAYYLSLSDRLLAEIILLAGVMIAGIVATWLSARTSWLTQLHNRTKKFREAGVALLVVGVGLLLASRPLWHVEYGRGLNSVVSGIQKATGYPVEPRIYSEYTVQWLEWYIGLPLLALALVGLAVLAGKVVSSKKYLLYAPFVLVFAGTALVYLLKPNITADHIWAMRRFLPIVIPGLIVFAFFALPLVADTLLKGRKLKPFIVRALYGAAAIGILLPALITARPFVKVRELTQLEPIRAVCRVLPDNAAVVWVWQAGNALAQPTRELCGVPAAKLAAYGPTKQQLKQMGDAMRRSGKEPFIGVFGNEVSHIAKDYESQNVTLVNGFSYHKMEQTLLWAPKQFVTINDSIVMARIAPDGSLKPLAPKMVQ
jgi:4-amino-4-deoxy-L-arabinose transferase-like glycosyltransferase